MASILAAILCIGILLMWVPSAWAVYGFELALFALAVARIGARLRDGKGVGVHPVAVMLALAAVWGLVQLEAGWTVDPFKTRTAILEWAAYSCAFALALDALSGSAERERYTRWMIRFAFGVCALAMFTPLAPAPGLVFWISDSGSGQPTFGPFVYRNQYAAFVEAILPLVLVRAMRGKALLYTLIAAAMFGSVVAAGSRAGAAICLAELLIVPAVAAANGWISRAALIKAAASTLAAAGLITAIVGWEFIWNRLQEPNPYAMRRQLVESSIAMVKDRPLTGFGLGTWASAYPKYALFDDGRFVNQAHNDWVQWAAEGGVPMFGIMLAVAGFMLRPAFRTVWGLGVIAVLVHSLVDYPMQQRPALAAFFFAMMGACGGQVPGLRRPGIRPPSPLSVRAQAG
jgi:O-antigen ligase